MTVFINNDQIYFVKVELCTILDGASNANNKKHFSFFSDASIEKTELNKILLQAKLDTLNLRVGEKFINK